ncbi:MAG: Rpn family recombination-promoting nuclease/putative transposase [Bacteroidales bacterium]|nr:Rpn family recombination-promoting nuclease/putative transposase [Bacteroidales bacterium]
MEKENEFLVRFDFAIKNMLRDKKNFDILEGFIEVFLGKKCKIQEILESESNQEYADDKFNRVDIKAKDTKGEIFIVEVQTTRYTYYLERILYGVSKAITEQLGNGDKYGNIKQVFSISVVYYDLGEGDDYFYECKSDFYGVHSHNILKLNRREELTLEEIKNGDTRKFKYEAKYAHDIFPKYFLIRINAYKKFIADAMSEWMEFLKNNSIKSDTTVPGLQAAKEKLNTLKMTKAERISYERHLDSIRNEKEAFWTAETDAYAAGEEKGRAEGIAEGKKQQSIEIARNFKKAGIDINIIAENTGLTIEEINAL